MKKIVCFHLFNDYSGSPKVLKLVLKGMLQDGCDVDVVTSKDGVLDSRQHPNAPRFHYYSYRFSQKPLLTTLRYAWVQLYTFFFAFRYIFRKDTLFYINTILPVAPAIAGRLMRKKVVYHYHENSFAKGFVYKALCRIMQYIATDIICVSEFQQRYLVRKEKTHIVPNVLPDNFKSRLHPDAGKAFDRRTVMMVASLKAYKGVREFFELAERLPQYGFVLVLNEEQSTIDRLIPPLTTHNVTIYARQSDITHFYNEKASVVLNLSDKNKVIETFGLTALEAMTAGLPVIVPTIGGISEFVEDGANGYKTDVQDINKIALQIDKMLSNKALYETMARHALNTASKYNETHFHKMIKSIIE